MRLSSDLVDDDRQSSCANSWAVGGQVESAVAKASRLRHRMEACRAGMQQLEKLRHKHGQLMQVIGLFSLRNAIRFLLSLLSVHIAPLTRRVRCLSKLVGLALVAPSSSLFVSTKLLCGYSLVFRLFSSV